MTAEQRAAFDRMGFLVSAIVIVVPFYAREHARHRVYKWHHDESDVSRVETDPALTLTASHREPVVTCGGMTKTGRTWAIVKGALATTVVAFVLVFLVDLLAGPLFSFSTQAWPPARQGDKLVGGIQGLIKATDLSASTVRISAGFLGLGSLPVVVTPETRIYVNGKLGGFGDLDRGQRVRVTYDLYPDRLVAARVELLERSSDASEALLSNEQSSQVVSPAPSEQTSQVASPARSSWTPVAPEVTSSPPPVTSVQPIRPAAPGAPRDAQAGAQAARSRAATRAPQTAKVSRSARRSPAENAASPDRDLQALAAPDSEATVLAPIVSTPLPPTPNMSPPPDMSPPPPPALRSIPVPPPSQAASTLPRRTAPEGPKSEPQSAPFEPALATKLRNDLEEIKDAARRASDEWREGWRRLQRLFTD